MYLQFSDYLTVEKLGRGVVRDSDSDLHFGCAAKWWQTMVSCHDDQVEHWLHSTVQLLGHRDDALSLIHRKRVVSIP